MMQTFKYSLFAKIIYRYSHLPVSLILAVHFIVTALGIPYSWYLAIPALINLVVLVWLNKFFFKSYKIFPFKIEIDNEKIICSDYFLKSKTVELKHSEIDKIEGGIFSKNLARPIYIKSTSKDVTFGVHNHLKNFNKFLTIVLSNINQDLYLELLEKVKEQAPRKKR